jgi:hypothetical protein
LSWFFGRPERGVTSAASRVRDEIGASDPGAVDHLQTQSDPEGGIPSGSLEVTWKLEDLEVEDLEVEDLVVGA